MCSRRSNRRRSRYLYPSTCTTIHFRFRRKTNISVKSHNFFYEFQLHPGPLTQTLAVIKTTNSTSIKSLKIKLTRKEQIPCLSFTVEMSPSVRQCVQDVPIHLVPRKDWSDIAQPTYDLVPNQYISIILPDVKRLKYMLDRYKTLGN